MQPADDLSAAERQWLKISLFCPSPLLEPAADLMGVLSGTGVEQSPETETGAIISGFFQLSAAGTEQQPEHSVERIHTLVEREMTDLFALYDLVPDKMHLTLLADQDWATSWQQYFKPFAIVPGLVIKPSWEDYQPLPGEAVIEMDPGMAFGTGQHASTSMALALIKTSMETLHPRAVLDVGTGTGILAMAAALFGAETIIAIDNDPDAVAVAQENIAHNQLSATIAVSATPIEQIQGPFQLVCANIVHDVLMAMSGLLTGLTVPGGHLVLAGLLSGQQEDNIKAVYGDLGWQILADRHQDEWAALLLLRT